MLDSFTFCRLGPLAIGWVPVTEHPDFLFASEAAAAAGFGPVRRREFAAARAAAHRTLERCGLPDGPILPGPDRVPVWPSGVSGSLAHTGAVAAAAAATAEWAVGLDVEDPSRVRPALAEAILTAPELTRLRMLDPARASRYLALAFSAKEAFFKLQYPLAGNRLCFPGVELAEWSARTFLLHTPLGVAPGRYWFDPVTGLQFTAVWFRKTGTALTPEA